MMTVKVIEHDGQKTRERMITIDNAVKVGDRFLVPNDHRIYETIEIVGREFDTQPIDG